MAGSELSGRGTSGASLRLRGFEEGGLGGMGLFNLALRCSERGGGGGSFSLVDLCLRDGLGFLAEEAWFEGDGNSAGKGVCVSRKIAFLGSMKCFIVQTNRNGF